MKLEMKFTESNQSFAPRFGEVNSVSDGGFDRGYAEGYNKGKDEFYEELIGGEW